MPNASANRTGLPNPQEYHLLRLPDVKKHLGVSAATVYRLVKSGRLSPPIKISMRISAWSLAAVLECIANAKTPEGGGHVQP